MIDFKQLLNDPEGAARRLARKGVPKEETERAARFLRERNRLLKETETLRAEKNALSRETGRLKRKGLKEKEGAKKNQNQAEPRSESAAGAGKKLAEKKLAENPSAATAGPSARSSIASAAEKARPAPAEKTPAEKPPGKKNLAEGGGIEERKQKTALLKDRLIQKEAALQAAQTACRQALLRLPNFPDDKAPEGKTEAESPVIKRDFRPEDFAGQKPPPHWKIAEELGIFEQKRASKISGPLFAVLRGDGAKLLRALLSLAFQIFEDYTELIVPALVGSEAFTGTGHLPKFAEEAYHIEKDDLWLIPTGEVPLTALHAGEILTDLPLKYMTCTSCFRREAGAAGERTRGLQRLHEFHKLELVKICRPEDSQKELDLLLEDALKPVQALKLPWRVRDLCAGDLTFASARTYDIEVYSPGTGRWLEVSSVGLFTDYQSRRSRIRFRDLQRDRRRNLQRDPQQDSRTNRVRNGKTPARDTAKSAALASAALASADPAAEGAKTNDKPGSGKAPARDTAGDTAGSGGALRFPHTLNGSGLAVPRVYAALLECGRQDDGRVLLPEVLQDFMNCRYIEKQKPF